MATSKKKSKAKAKAKSKPKTKAPVKVKTKPKAKPKAKATAKKAKSKTAKKVTAKPKKVAKVASSAKAPAKTTIRWAEIFTPLDDRLVVQVIEDASVSSGGIIIPSSALTKSQNQGEVVLVGRGHRDTKGRTRPMDVSVGDQVLFPAYAGSKMKVMGHEVLVLREGDVLGIVES